MCTKKYAGNTRITCWVLSFGVRRGEREEKGREGKGREGRRKSCQLSISFLGHGGRVPNNLSNTLRTRDLGRFRAAMEPQPVDWHVGATKGTTGRGERGEGPRGGGVVS